jgi:TolB-like protein/Tfp pilus assembly protein PilF
MAHLQQLIMELRRRRVFRSAGIYIVAAWVAVQVASLIFPATNIPESALLYVWLAALFLFPLAIVFAWSYDLSFDGLTRTPSVQSDDLFDPSLRSTDYIILSALTVVAIAITWQFSMRIEGSPEYGQDAINPFSIAVLPLDNISGDSEQEYLVSGMQSGLIASLSRVRALRVTSKTSTLGFQGTGISLPDIGKQLGVANIIEGSIYRLENRVRLAVQLLDARTDEHIWSATFEDEIEDIMLLQSKVAQAVAREVRVTLSADEQALFDGATGVNAAAYEAFIKGEFYVEQFTAQGIRLGANYFAQAVELDPDYALAHWGLAKLCAFQGQAGLITPEQAREQCLPHTLKALELDPLLAEAHMGLAGALTWQQFDWEKAGPAFEKSIEINPSYAEGRMFYSHYLGIIGRLEESTEQMRIALKLDPLNPFVRGLYGVQLTMLGNYEEAAVVAEEVTALAPGFAFGYIVTWYANAGLEEHDKAIAGVANYYRHIRGNVGAAELLETSYNGSNYEDALVQLAEFLIKGSASRHVEPLRMATLYEQADEWEKAIDWFETAFRERDPNAPYMGVLSKTQEINDNPRFHKLLRDMKLDYWADKYSQPET